MIEQVEKVHAEPQILPLRQPERLVESEVHVFLGRSNNAIARGVAVDRRIAARAVGKSRERVRCIRQGIDPVR